MSHEPREPSPLPLHATARRVRRASAALARVGRSLSLALGLGLTLASACAGDSDGESEGSCDEGFQGCTCFANQTCLSGLVCVANTCVPPGNATTSASTGATGTTGTTNTTTSDGTGTTADETSASAGTNTTTNTTSTTSNTTEPGTTTAGTEEGGPKVVDFGTNVKTITEGETVIFTATITDPDGPDDIQGGSLKSSDESITFGAFTDLGNGTYELTLSWAAIDQAIGIEFAGTDTVDFKAVFFDNDGKKGFASTSITLTCGDEYAILACDGHCVHADVDDDNCGSCGNACGDLSSCAHGSCDAAWGACVATANSPHNNCAEYCQAQGEGCVAGCDPEYSVWYWQELNNCGGQLFIDSDLSPYEGNCHEDIYFDPMYVASVRCCCTADAVWP